MTPLIDTGAILAYSSLVDNNIQSATNFINSIGYVLAITLAMVAIYSIIILVINSAFGIIRNSTDYMFKK